MSQLLEPLFSEIQTILTCFSTDQKDKLKAKLFEFKSQSTDEIAKFNTFMQKNIKLALTTIMSKSDLKTLSELLQLICEVAQGKNNQASATFIKDNNYNQLKQISNSSIKPSLAIIMVEDILQCLGINDLKQILPVISQKICSFEELDQVDQNRMLRVINHLLKRISKTEDYLIRGELQFTLTKILPLLHDSGFHYRTPLADSIQIIEDQEDDQFKDFSSEGVTLQFYKDFWDLQKYLANPNKLISENKNDLQNSGKKTQNYRADPIISMRLKNMENTLSQLIRYMNLHPCTGLDTSLLAQPIKFLTNSNLLELQLKDSYFRKIIMIQFLIFALNLKNHKTSNNILKGTFIAQSDRQIIIKMESMAQSYLQSISKKNIEDQQQNINILEFMKNYFSIQIDWIQLKDYWKQKKKSFFRKEANNQEANLDEKKKNKVCIDYSQKCQEINNRISTQMSIERQNIANFLSQSSNPSITSKPTQVSFAYYWGQSKNCLESFDHEKGTQCQFEDKSQYNLFQWKASRSLYRQNIKQVSLGQKNPSFKNYRLLSFVERRQKIFAEKLKLSNSAIIDQSSQVNQSFDKSKQSIQSANAAPQQNNNLQQSKKQLQNQQVVDSVTKKVKTDSV